MHVYLCTAYGMLDMATLRDFHLCETLLLAGKCELWYCPASQYYFMPKMFLAALSDFPEDFKKHLVKASNDVYLHFVCFTDALSLNSVYQLVMDEDYIFLYDAVQWLTNKKIAHRLHISAGTVGKRYDDIYALLVCKRYFLGYAHLMSEVQVRITQTISGVLR